jgi:hypothetical protein
MPKDRTFRKAAGRAIAAFGLIAGLGAGAAAGVFLPALPWIAAFVASFITLALGGAGFLFSGEVFATSCPCCQTRTVATTWRQTFQCRRCQTMCALAALRQRRHLRPMPPVGRA